MNFGSSDGKPMVLPPEVPNFKKTSVSDLTQGRAKIGHPLIFWSKNDVSLSMGKIGHQLKLKKNYNFLMILSQKKAKKRSIFSYYSCFLVWTLHR